METQSDFKNPLLSIPERKINDTIQKITESFSDSKESIILIEAIERYAGANIPVDYWDLNMQDFSGDKVLLKTYNDIVSNIENVYLNGIKYCLAGSHGNGKTMTVSCILKKVVEKGYSGLYTTLADIISVMASKDNDKFEARKVLMDIDFLIIDEFDPRFMGSDNAADLYGRIIEPILRNRIQNKLPLLLCTNSPNPTSGFTGSLKQSIGSLMSLIHIIPVLGSDYRPVAAKANK
jgi:DNA replication protein DnaC